MELEKIDISDIVAGVILELLWKNKDISDDVYYQAKKLLSQSK